jgi:cell division initiation protein
MSYTPVELRHVRVGRRPLGYDRAGVEQILSDVADSFETVWRDRGELQDRVETLEQSLTEAKQREQLLTNTLLAAEHAAEEMRERARREAELIVSEAHAEARAVLQSTRDERERLLAEVRRIEVLLQSALAVVSDAGEPAEQQEPEEPRDLRPIAASPEPEPAPAPAVDEQPTDESVAVPEEEQPGWPPLRRVAQGGADFDWGD